MLFGDGMKPPNSKYAGPTDEPTLHRTRRRPRGLLLQSFPPLFCIYIFALILLPTGQFFGANIKVILFVPLIMAASAEYCRLSSTSYLTMGGLVMIVFISHAFGVQLMSMDLDDIGGRIQFISDSLIPLCLFAVFGLRPMLKVSQKFALLFSVLAVISALFTFSRFLWGFSLLGIFLGLVVGKKETFHWIWTVIVVGIIIFNFHTLAQLVTLRFSVEQAGSSDLIRIEQTSELIRVFWDAPFWGHGLGSHSWRVIRSPSSPYSYENQLFALAGQVGIIGLFLLASLLIYYFRKILPQNKKEALHNLSVIVLLVAWITGGFANPWLISSAGSISYGVLLAFIQLKRQDRVVLCSI
jgi:hypothetical protein